MFAWETRTVPGSPSRPSSLTFPVFPSRVQPLFRTPQSWKHPSEATWKKRHGLFSRIRKSEVGYWILKFWLFCWILDIPCWFRAFQCWHFYTPIMPEISTKSKFFEHNFAVNLYFGFFMIVKTIFGVRRPCAALALLQNFCIPASANYL